VVFPGIQNYTDMAPGPDGKVFGVADQGKFFVFDPVTRKVVFEKDLTVDFGPTISHQGPRVFIPGPKGIYYMFFRKGIVRLDPQTYAMKLLATSPVSITNGGGLVDGRLYFAAEAHVYSYQVPEEK